jgi:hypothetical protein
MNNSYGYAQAIINAGFCNRLCLNLFYHSETAVSQATNWVPRPDFYCCQTVCRGCWCGAPSLTREGVCRLQLLLVLASAVILGSETRGTHDHVLLSQIRDSSTWRARTPYLYLPGTERPSDTARHCAPFSSHANTHRATVEVFEQASTRESLLKKRGILFIGNNRYLRNYTLSTWQHLVTISVCVLAVTVQKALQIRETLIRIKVTFS